MRKLELTIAFVIPWVLKARIIPQQQPQQLQM